MAQEHKCQLARMLTAVLDLPAIAVGGVSIDAKLDQELDDLGVSGTDGVVQRGDALVIRRAGIVHLHQRPPLMIQSIPSTLDYCLQNHPGMMVGGPVV